MNISILFLPDNCVLQFAANELKEYLLKMNPQFQIRFDKTDTPYQIQLCADTPHLESEDSYEIQIQNLTGFISGSNPRSVLLGVYKYLWLLGCRFLRPGKKYEKIPSLNQMESYNAAYKGKAFLYHRGVCIEGANSLSNIMAFIDWLPKLGFNSFFIQFQIPYAFMNLWYQHKYNPLLPKEPFTMETAIEFSKQIDKEIEKRGLLYHKVGHGWTSEVLGKSALGWVEANDILTEETKQLTALINGKRGYFKGIPINTNLCYTNPTVISLFVDHVVDYAKSHIEVNYLHIWLADEANNFCECENCQKELPADQYIAILNKIDEKLTQLHLSTKLVFLLYHELLWSPKKEKLKNPERFVLMFAPISRTFDSSYQERKKLSKIPVYKRNQITLPSSLEENLAFLKEWQTVFTGDSFVYDYPLGRSHYGDLGYISISKILYQDIKELPNLKLNGYISCQELRSCLPNALPNYIMGITLFDSSSSFQEVAQDYFASAYGNDWKLVFSYFDTLSNFYSCDYFNGKGNRINAQIAKNMKLALVHIETFYPTIQKNIKNTTSIENIFWKHLDYHWKYSILLTKALYELSSGNQEEMQKVWYEFLHFIQSHEQDFQECFDVYRITEVATKYTKFTKEKDEY